MSHCSTYVDCITGCCRQKKVDVQCALRESGRKTYRNSRISMLSYIRSRMLSSSTTTTTTTTNTATTSCGSWQNMSQNAWTSVFYCVRSRTPLSSCSCCSKLLQQLLQSHLAEIQSPRQLCVYKPQVLQNYSSFRWFHDLDIWPFDPESGDNQNVGLSRSI